MQQVMSHISAIKKDMIVLEKSEFSTLRHEYEVRHMYQFKPVKLLNWDGRIITNSRSLRDFVTYVNSLVKFTF